MMRKAVMAGIVGAGIAVSTAHGQSAGDTIYAKRDGAELRSGPDRTSPVAAELKEGDPLSVIEVDGVRFKVTGAGGEGYISKLHVSADKPKAGGGRSSLIRSDLGPDERSSVASIRGLSDEAKQYAEASQAPEKAIADAEKMEANGRAADASRVAAFMKEGGIVEQ